MEKLELRTLRNTGPVAQSVVYNKRQFTLGPDEEQAFEAKVAEAFLLKCAPVVVDMADETVQHEVKVDETKYLWIANMTGNPRAADFVSARLRDKATTRWTEIQIKNINKPPRTLRREEKGGHQQYWASDGGLMQVSLPSKMWELKPFERKRFPVSTGNWFVEMDQSNNGYAGACIVSRPPSAFEPDMTWSLDEMRTYLKLTDPSEDLGPDEMEVTNAVKTKVNDMARKAERGKKPMSEAAIKHEMKEGLREAIYNAKRDLFKTLYFKLVDPQYNLPTRAEFVEATTGHSSDDIADADLEALLAQSDATQGAQAPAKETKAEPTV